MIYLTYNDAPSGIYSSQVVDVVKFLNSIQQKEHVQLLALISARHYFKERKAIKALLPESTVLPMFPGVKQWKKNLLIIRMFCGAAKSGKMMARGPFAAELALQLRESGIIKTVLFDARGAYKAELNEYNVINDDSLKSEIAVIEQDALRRCDKILAVSSALINYWKEEYDFSSFKHVVIPCTLNADFNTDFPKENELISIKKEIGLDEEDIVMVYSGSSAGWQSFSLVEQVMQKVMEGNPKLKLLWLTNDLNNNSEFVKKYRNRIITNWLKPADVRRYLLAADYGILFREQSTTNKVASPVKFAEYLSCGLKIIISKNLGDFSQFTKENQCGITEESLNSIGPVSYDEKLRVHNLAINKLTKERFIKQYLFLLE